MANGIYFIEPNSSIVSDFESYFLINDDVKFLGGSGSFQQALGYIKTNPEVRFLIINERAIDADCLTMLGQLGGISAVKVVTLETNNEVLKDKLSQMGVITLVKPYSYGDLENIFNGSIPVQQPAQPFQATGSALSDNPFMNNRPNGSTPIASPSARPDIQERLRNIRRNPPENKNKIIKQKVVAIHNQKGGVGKSTIAKELATALRCMKIQLNGEEYKPKVCLCDFDLDSSDIVSLLNLPTFPNISLWVDDLEEEARRTGQSIENVRFTERDIKENYLLRDANGSGIYVLAAPEDKTESTRIHMEHIEGIIENLKLCDFDIIILDTGPNIFDYTIMSLMKSDIILAISTCEVASAKRLDGVIADILTRMPEYNPDKVKLVINKYDPNINISPQELIDVLNLELYGVIPSYPEISNMNNSGYSAFYNKARNKEQSGAYTASIIEIAKKVSGIDKLQQRSNPQLQGQQPTPNMPRPVQQPPQQQFTPPQQNFAPQQQTQPKKKKGFFKSFFGGKD